MQDFVSVIIPTYNRGYIIKKSIRSILNQSYKNFELIIVDDCSKDNTQEVVKSINDERIKYIKLQKNSGANKARNIGIQSAKYELIAFHDSDDEWHENKLEKQIKYLKDYNLDLVASKYNQYVDCEFNQIIPQKNIEDNFLEKLLQGNYIGTPTLLVKKKCLQDESFDERLPRFQDWELSIRLLKKYKFGFINESLVNAYIQKNSISKNSNIALEAFELIYKKHEAEFKTKKKIAAEMMRIIYAQSILNQNIKKEYIKESIRLSFGVKNFIFYIINLFNLENMYLKLKNNGDGK